MSLTMLVASLPWLLLHIRIFYKTHHRRPQRWLQYVFSLQGWFILLQLLLHSNISHGQCSLLRKHQFTAKTAKKKEHKKTWNQSEFVIIQFISNHARYFWLFQSEYFPKCILKLPFCVTKKKQNCVTQAWVLTIHILPSQHAWVRSTLSSWNIYCTIYLLIFTAWKKKSLDEATVLSCRYIFMILKDQLIRRMCAGLVATTRKVWPLCQRGFCYQFLKR